MNKINDEFKFNIELLKDPITFEYFKNPKILDCGHTFDYDTLLNIKKSSKNNLLKCPICNNIFSSNIDIINNNWILVNILDLKLPIQNKKLDSIVCKNDIKKITADIIGEEGNLELIKLYNDIKKAALEGKYNYSFIVENRFKKYNYQKMWNIVNFIKDKLKNQGYGFTSEKDLCCCFICCCFYNNLITINWN